MGRAMEDGLEGWTMWLIATSVYTRCHGDAMRTTTRHSRRIQEASLANNATKTQINRALDAIELCLPVPKQPYSTENVSCVSITEMVEAEHVRGGSVNDVRSCSSRCSRKSRVSRLNRYDKYSRGSLYTLFSSSFILQSPASLSGQSIIVDITNRQLHHAIIFNCIEPIAPVLARHHFAPS